MTKQEWIEWFEALNEREPNEEEINLARQNGEFVETQDVEGEVELPVATETEDVSDAIAQEEEVAVSDAELNETVEKSTDSTSEPDQSTQPKAETPISSTLSNAQGYVEKAKQMTKNKKWLAIVLPIIAGLALLWIVFGNQPKSALKDNAVTFSGIDSKGTATLNTTDIYIEIGKIIAEKHGITMENALSTLANSEKAKKIYDMTSNIKVTIDRTSELKNGDIVKVTVNAPEGSGVKSETREYKVSGLKPVQKISITDVLTPEAISFSGYDGFGTYKTENFGLVSNHSDDSLKNGDKLVLSATKSYLSTLENEGKLIEGPITGEVTVSGLKNVNTIKNIADVFRKNHELAEKSLNNSVFSSSSTTYKVAMVTTYVYIENYGDEFEANIYSIFKVDKTTTSNDKTETTTTYRYYGHTGLELYQDQLILADLSSNEMTYSPTFENQESAEIYLKGRGYVKYEFPK